MAVPIRHKDFLKSYVDNQANAAWVRDLVSLAILTGGVLTDVEHMKVLDELENNIKTPTVSIPPSFVQNDPLLKLLKLKHVHGVNALANNQEVAFCDEGMTVLYGHNRSGKSGYFRILNQMAGGEVNHTLYPNVHTTSPEPIEVTLEYSQDGNIEPVFTWDGVIASPPLIRHIRFFDSQYASTFLSSRGNNTFFFKSQNLMVFKAVNDTLDLFKGMGVSIDSSVEFGLRNLCSTTYRDTLSQALVVAFQDELNQLGMDDLKVSLSVGDLLDDSSQIAIKLNNSIDIHGVLSEAELKCAALALFFAECELMPVKQPIILDDPVNSLDDIFIERLTHRLSRLSNQIVIFTHSILFQEALTDERRFKVYYDPTKTRRNATTAKKHVLVYDVLTSSDRFGYVLGRDVKKTKYYLEKADQKLSATPVTDMKGIVDDLRFALEWSIDEVVFRGLAPHRFKGSELTDWDEMRAMATAGANNIDDLQDAYNQLSSILHVGFMSYVSPGNVTQLRGIYNKILAVYQTL